MPGSIDTHAHVFSRGLATAPGARYVPDYDASLAAYLAFLDAYDLARGVLVQPSFLGSDNAFLVDSLAAAGGRLAGVAVMETAFDAAELEALAAGGVVGLRYNLIGRAPDVIATPLARQTISAAARRGWHIELHADAPDLLAALAALPAFDGPIVIDHCGRPADDQQLLSVLALRDDSRILVKLSAPYRFALGAGAALGSRFVDAFGVERLLWGSDWPWTQFEDRTTFDKVSPKRFGLDAATVAGLDATAARLFFGER
jgi:predicted TIM-barrel fold metal-dependent hydrolase